MLNNWGHKPISTNEAGKEFYNKFTSRLYRIINFYKSRLPCSHALNELIAVWLFANISLIIYTNYNIVRVIIV
jgi:hypothetical protein